MLALKWDDVDFENKSITIKSTINRIHDPEQHKSIIIQTDPKTKTGRRKVPIITSMIPVLLDHKKRMEAEKIAAGSAWVDNNLVFPSNVGTHTEPRRVNTTMDKITNAAGMDHFTVHSLRHTFATRLLEADVSARVVQELLGHSDVTLTLNTYSHVLESTAHEHIARIDNLFGFEPEPIPVTKPTKKIETKTSEKKGVRQSLNNAKEKAKAYNDNRDLNKEIKRDQPSL